MQEIKFLEKIGKGNSSEVFLAKYTSIDSNEQFCAVKIIEKNKNTNEIEILKSLNHPNLVCYINSFHDHDKNYIILEYIKGVDILTWRKSNTDIRDIDCLVDQICIAIKYIHSCDIVHGDLSSKNILIQNIKIKVLDFGESAKESQKKIYTIITPKYASPEIISQKIIHLSKISDLWSSGIILFELITGEAPFKGNTINSIYERILHKKIDFKEYKLSKKHSILLKNLLKKDLKKRKLINNIF